MPTWNEISAEVDRERNVAFSILDNTRYKYLNQLHQKTDRNVISYYSGWLQNITSPPHFLSVNDNDKAGFMATIHGLDRRKGLDLILHTPGGSVAATESLVEYLHSMFGNDIRAIIPQLAMSAGTMIACACKEILMGKHSSIGPIDPQVGGRPAHGIIDAFERAKNSETSQEYQIWLTLLAKCDPTTIGECEKAIKWSTEIVTNWLSNNMFKDKDAGESKEIIVKITEELGRHEKTLTHDRHISPESAEKLGLKILHIEDNQELQDCILSIHHATMLSFTRSTAYKIIENHLGTRHIEQASPSSGNQ